MECWSDEVTHNIKFQAPNFKVSECSVSGVRFQVSGKRIIKWLNLKLKH